MWFWDSGSGMWINSDTGDVSISQPSAADDGMGFGSGEITSGTARTTAPAQNAPLSATTDASFANRIVQVGAQAFQYTPSRNAAGQTIYVPSPVHQQSSSFNMIAILGVIGLVLLMRGGHSRGA